MLCAELMWAQWSLMCNFPLHLPAHSPQPASPQIPTITLPSHTIWPCNQHTTQHSIIFTDICRDKDLFYLPFFTHMHLHILMNPVRLTQKTKHKALILKLGKSTSQEINPNCRLRVPGAFGNWESRQLSAHYAVDKRK